MRVKSGVFGQNPPNTPIFRELYINGYKVGAGRMPATEAMLFSADETTDIGSNTATPVSDDYGLEDSKFTEKVKWVQIDLGADKEDADHLITPEVRQRVAMAQQ